ncbi:MAG: hypothetical protein GY874_04650 [Desulfobacteraceae bacterium]|nr:hypothetical protein [Desulfobacteraceae bacterium]
MFKNLEMLPNFSNRLQSMMDLILTNILLIGQIPAPTFSEEKRVAFFMERLIELQIDECTTDGYRNPIGIVRGKSRDKPPIFVVAHMDTPFSKDIDHNFTVKQDTISGTGLMDNSLGAGVLLSLPEIFRLLEISFDSDIVLAGVIQSIGKGNLRGIRHLLKTWSAPIRGAICIESGELGRLNYYTDGMIRCEINCTCKPVASPNSKFSPNAIVVINEVINQIQKLRLPLKPRCKVIFGTIEGGVKHGDMALEARLGLEIRSDYDELAKDVYTDIQDIVSGIEHEYDIKLILKTISHVRAARLKYNHPLVKSAVAIMETLGIKPFKEPSTSELSIFLSRKIPALTLGVTYGKKYHQTISSMQIDPMFKGIAQIVGAIMAIDSGICDESPMD